MGGNALPWQPDVICWQKHLVTKCHISTTDEDI